MTYQVKDWDKHFENDRSRSRDRCSFVCVPNKQHGMGFCRVMSEPDGAAIYGIWQLILGACSQQSRPRNGWLTSDGEETGTPWGVEDLALKFRRPVQEVQRAITVLSSQVVGWLTVIGEPTINSPPTPHALTADSLGREGKGRERKEGNAAHPAPLPLEAELWNSHPNLPKVLNVSTKRLGALQSRRKDLFFVANVASAIEKIASSPFCLGENDRGWKATFDFLLQPDTVTKAIEGKYDHSAPKPRIKENPRNANMSDPDPGDDEALAADIRRITAPGFSTPRPADPPVCDPMAAQVAQPGLPLP